MTSHSFKVALIAAITFAACLLMTAPTAIAERSAYKLEGAWVTKVVGFGGQWSYVLVPDSSGRRAAGHGSIDVGFDPAVFGCAFGEQDTSSPILVSLKMTGPDTAIAYSVWYALNSTASGGDEIVYIGVVNSEIHFIAPGKGESTHYFSFYLPSQDVDPADGFPDEGQTPACVAPVPVYAVDTRMPAP
jgi:hypothetical protein